MSNSTRPIAEDQPPEPVEKLPERRAKKWKKRQKHGGGQLSKARKGVVMLVFGLQLLVALVGLVVVPDYLVYEFFVR